MRPDGIEMKKGGIGQMGLEGIEESETWWDKTGWDWDGMTKGRVGQVGWDWKWVREGET